MKRNTNLNNLASKEQADTRRPDASNSSFQKGKRKQTDTIVILDNRLMPYSYARSISRAEEPRLVLKHVREALEPQDILGDHASEVITDQIIQIRMLDRFRAHVLERARGDAIIQLLVGRLENEHGLVLAMLKGDEAARATIKDSLARFGIPEEAINAEAFMIIIDQIERLNSLSAQAQIRIDLQLKQVERRRPMLTAEIKALAHTEIETHAHDEDQEGYDPDRSEPYHSAPNRPLPRKDCEGSDGVLTREDGVDTNRGAQKDNAEEII